MSILKSNVTRHSIRKHTYDGKIGILNVNTIASNVNTMDSTVNIVDSNVNNPEENVNNKSTSVQQCHKCNKILANSKSLKYHSNICKGVLNPMECHNCHKIFNTSSAKSKHLKMCTPPPPAPPALPPHEPYKKKQIPQSVRIAVWDTYIGRAIGETTCTVCNNSKISQFNFHCGHIIAEKYGGTISIENLRPICKSCNSSMRTCNLEEYKLKYFNTH